MRLPNWLKFALAASLLSTQLACQGTVDTPPSEASPAVRATVKSEKISQEEALQFAEDIVAKIGSDDLQSLEGTFDYETFLERAFGGLDIPSREMEQIRSGFIGELKKQPGGFFREFAAGKLKVLRTYDSDTGSKALIRLLDANSGAVTYLEFYLKKDGETIKVYDINSFATGEPVSETIRRLILPMVSQLTKTPLQKLVGGGSDDIKQFEDVVEMMNKTKAGQYDEAIKIYDQLPTTLQNSKPVLITYVTTTMEMNDDDRYLAALERFKENFADDPAMLLHSIDYYFLKKDYDAMMTTIDKVEKSLGIDDPYLQVLRSSGYTESKQFDKAVAAARKAAKAEPTMEEAHWAMVTAGLEGKDNAAVAEGLEGLKTFYPDSLDVITDAEEYAEFRKSAEGKEFKAGL